MQFRILGPLEVTDGDRLVELGGPRPRTLLSMLLVEANRTVSADALIAGIWGDDPPARVVTGLQVLISNLRRALEPDRPAREAARVLVTRPPGYVLAVEPDHLDAARFEGLVTRGRALLENGDAAGAVDALSEALGLWRGAALAEVATEDFARPEAVRLEELRIVAGEDRIQASLHLGRHGAAVPELERLVIEHPLRERLWGLLMLAYYRSGRQADALRTFQLARQRLGDELGIDPGPDLQRLEAEVLAQAPALDWRPAPAPLPAPPPPPPAPVPAPSAGRGLVGREPELQRLRTALDDTTSGRGRLVLISGDAGAGKTRLLDELTRLAAAGGALVGWGRCHEGDSAPPFWPWIQVLRGTTAEAGVDLAALAEPVAAALVQLVPELRPGSAGAATAATGAPASLSDASHARSQVFQALATFLVHLTATRSLVLVVDDLQWADAPSLELLSFLAAQLGDSRLLLLGTFRPAEVDHDHPFCHALATLTRHQWAERISLEGMAPDGVAALIASVTGAKPPAELAAAVHARTDGNPFFVLELVRMLQADGTLAAADAGAVVRSPVPLGVRDVIRQRLGQLTAEARTVLTIAAVAGREFDERLLEDAGDEDADTVLTALELAAARGILTEVPGAVGRYRFSHGLIQETIYGGLSAVRQARIHARVASALERRPLTADDAETRATDLAHHFWHAVPAVGASKAATYTLAAADRAVDQLAYERAQELLERVLGLVKSLPAEEAATAELAARTRLGRLLAALVGHAAPDVRAAFARARDLCQTLQAGAPDHEQVAARWGLFYSLYIGGDRAGAEAVAGELLALAESGAVPAAATAGHLAVGIASFHVGSLATAHRHLAASVDLADATASGDRDLAAAFQVDPRVYGRCFLALVLGLTGEGAEAQAVAARARDLAAELGQPFSAATASLFTAWLGFVVADPPTARRYGAETVALSATHGFRLLAAAGSVFEGWALAHDDPAAGAARLRDAVQAFESLGSPLGQSLFRVALAEAAHLDGRSGEALDILRQLIAQRGGGGSGHYFDAGLHRLYAEIVLVSDPDGVEEAHEHLQLAVDLARAQGASTLEARALAAQVSAL